MPVYDDLREFMEMLGQKGRLVRVARDVGPILEINAIVDRPARKQGLAALFLMISDRREQDLEHPGLSPRGEGARLGVDATRKWKEDNCTRESPDLVTMDSGVMEKVLVNWKTDGLT